MDKAIEDKTAEYQKQQSSQNQSDKNNSHQNKDSDDEDDLDDDEREIIEKMKQERLKEYSDKAISHAENEKKTKQEKEVWYGEYTEIVESEFLTYVTKAKFTVVHFVHKDFEKCKVMDMHIQKIAPKHKECKFLKLDAEKAPFFVTKLAIKVLPTLCLFINGVLQEKIVGFEGLGGVDNFKTMNLVRK